jgi:peroxiredoxin
LRGIEIGKPFPNIPLWTADGAKSTTLHDLLPDGGMVFYVSSVCESCIDAVAALNDAILAADGTIRSVALISDSKSETLAKTMNERGIVLPLYADLEDRLLGEHNVRTTRTFFVLGQGWILNQMGTSGFQVQDYTPILDVESQGS